MKIKVIGFDLDGTVCDTIPVCIRAFISALNPYVEESITEEKIRATFGLNESGMIQKLVKEQWREALEDFYHFYEQEHITCQNSFPGISELLSFLKKENIKVLLITGKGERSCNITLGKIGLEQVFDEKIYGSEKTPNKAEAIRRVLEKYRIKPKDFLYIGDTLSDIEACRRAGVLCCSAGWGRSEELLELKQKNPKHVYETVCELKKFLENGCQ